MEDFKSNKKNAIEVLTKLIDKSSSFSTEDAINYWKEFTNHPFFSYFHKAEKTKLFKCLEGDEPSENSFSEVDLYPYEYIQKTRNELEIEGLGTKKYFLIAGVDGADDMCFLCSDFSSGVAILYHEYVFCSEKLDEELDKAAKELSLVDFFQCLEQRADPRLTANT